MAWLPLHTNLPQHPKLKRLARALQVSIPQAIGHLACFWLWCLEYAPSGSIERFDAADLEDAAGWSYLDGAFLSAMIETGFIDRIDDALVVHDWSEFGGRYDQRRKDATRRSHARWSNTSDDDRSSHAKKMATARWRKHDEASDAYARKHDEASDAYAMLNDAYAMLAIREDKRREEENILPTVRESSTPSGAPKAPVPPVKKRKRATPEDTAWVMRIFESAAGYIGRRELARRILLSVKVEDRESFEIALGRWLASGDAARVRSHDLIYIAQAGNWRSYLPTTTTTIAVRPTLDNLLAFARVKHAALISGKPFRVGDYDRGAEWARYVEEHPDEWREVAESVEAEWRGSATPA